MNHNIPKDANRSLFSRNRMYPKQLWSSMELLETKRVMAFFYRRYYLFYYTHLFTGQTPVEDLYNQNHDSRDGEIYTLASENKLYFGTCIKLINQSSKEIAYLEVGSVLCSEIMI